MLWHPPSHYNMRDALVDLVEACSAPSVDDLAQFLEPSSAKTTQEYLLMGSTQVIMKHGWIQCEEYSLYLFGLLYFFLL